ncbi:hypothetical protein [Rhodanobacter sp. BL-MT-08]
MNTIDISTQRREPWNKGKLTGQKAPLRLCDIWAIRIRLQLARKFRDLALFDLAIDSKLRAFDLVKLRVRDVGSADHISSRTIVLQLKTQRPVQFEITAPTRNAISPWIKKAQLQFNAYLFKPDPQLGPPFNSSIPTNCQCVDCRNRFGRCCLRYAHHASYKSYLDLPMH